MMGADKSPSQVLPQGVQVRNTQGLNMTGCQLRATPERACHCPAFPNARQQVLQYQNQSKKLPKALRDWPAYNACRKTIDDFLEMLPLFQALTHKSMRERHWKDVMRITGHELNLAEDVFRLQVGRYTSIRGCFCLCKRRCQPP